MNINTIVFINIINCIFVNSYIVVNKDVNNNQYLDINTYNNTLEEINNRLTEENVSNAFNGVYTECFFRLSYTCIQKKTLLYLYELNRLKEVSVFGSHLKFVKINTTNAGKEIEYNTKTETYADSNDLSLLIDKAVDYFFDKHVLRISALGKDISVPRTVDEFVGRKRRKGGGGGGHGGGDDSGGGHQDGGRKKMMMMAMMCMKMKLMMMVPAMMGMMGMMSFKGMMFSMMSFMIAKMMLLMKILEKKNGGGGGGGGGGGDGAGWAAGGGAGGAWMPAGQDYGGGANGGGGYDANGQWQSRSIPTHITEEFHHELEPIFNDKIKKFLPKSKGDKSRKRREVTEHFTDKVDPIFGFKINKLLYNNKESKSRKRRGILDILQNAYAYWTNTLLGLNNVNKKPNNQQKYKIVNGIKYVYYPMKYLNKQKAPKAIQPETVNNLIEEETKPMVAAEDFNKGEIMEGGFESRMQKKKMNKLKKDINEALEESPWQ